MKEDSKLVVNSLVKAITELEVCIEKLLGDVDYVSKPDDDKWATVVAAEKRGYDVDDEIERGQVRVRSQFVFDIHQCTDRVGKLIALVGKISKNIDLVG